MSESALTLLVMLHLAVLLPFQYVLHAYLLHHFSLLLMPVLFTFFGPVIEVLICIALYGWGVSWKPAVEAEPPRMTAPRRRHVVVVLALLGLGTSEDRGGAGNPNWLAAANQAGSGRYAAR